MSFLVPTNSGLIELSKEQLLRKRDCEKHFDKHQFDEEGERLRHYYPYLYLVFTDLEIAHGVPLSSNESDRNALSDHNYYKENSSGDVNATNDNMFVIGSPGDDFHGHPLCLETYTSSSTEDNIYSYIRHRAYKLLKNNILVYPSSKHLMLYQDAS